MNAPQILFPTYERGYPEGEYIDFLRSKTQKERLLLSPRYDGNTTYAADVLRLNEDLRASVPEALALYKEFIAWKLKK